MDTTKTAIDIAQKTGDPASAFISFLWVNYISNPVFLSMILVVFILLWVARVFVFDNKSIKWTAQGWAYPLAFIVIVAFVVWLKADIAYNGFKQYLADFITQLSATLFIYFVIGHRIVKWAGNWGAGKLGLNDDLKADVNSDNG